MRAQGMGIDRDLAVQVLEDVESVLATLGSAGYTLRDLSIRHIMLQVGVSSVSASSVHSLLAACARGLAECLSQRTQYTLYCSASKSVPDQSMIPSASALLGRTEGPNSLSRP